MGMALDDAQQLLDRHPSVFVAIFPVYFVTLWLLVGATISFVGGWFSLAKVYRTRVPFDGAKWRMQSGQMRWLCVGQNLRVVKLAGRGWMSIGSRLLRIGARCH
jgi:hypothetical protein